MIRRIKRLIGEPIFLFLVMGSLLFYIYRISNTYLDKNNKKIYVNEYQVALLVEKFEKTWDRSPNEDEHALLIEEHIMDEVFYREAVALGLDKSDPMIKRRLRQTMELVMDNNINVYPSESQLQDYLLSHPEKFRIDPSISFIHRYYPIENKQIAIEELSLLKQGKTPEASFYKALSLIPEEFDDINKQKVETTFGENFSVEIFNMKANSWQGPVQSAYGWHLVYVHQIAEGETPPLSEIWDMVEREWTFERKMQDKATKYEQLKAGYEVIMESSQN